MLIDIVETDAKTGITTRRTIDDPSHDLAPAPLPDNKGDYAKATTTDDKLSVIARMLGLI